ncbi:sensor histidine kinase [Oceanibium sediminis]|uniref:sensor histidine kinase n=1 Tax=Oceanibium sediminis TaxID=2026339 RepID=UPI0018E52F9C|nr:ATP-binding protein [Oceanibium sediminis]
MLRFAVGLLCVASVVAAYLVAHRVSSESAQARARSQAVFYKSTLDAALERPAALPHILARDAAVIDALERDDGNGLNRRLEGFAEAAEVDAIYLMDRNGDTIAASNWRETVTFLGQNYGFRPYFRAAISGTPGEFFAIGATSGLPGYFVAEPVRGGAGAILGVVAIKIDLNRLADIWRAAGERVLVVNPDGIVVLASDPRWRYQTIAPLGATRRAALSAARQFGEEPLSPLNWIVREPGLVAVEGREYLHHMVPVGRLGWQVHYLGDLAPVRERARIAMGVSIFVLGLILAAGLAARTRRIRTALRISQDDRRALRGLNEELGREIEERRRAEARLEAAQSELAAASRLAALGQLSASVTHELGQPLSAMRNYIVSLRMNGAGEDIGKFTQRMEKVISRMEALTRQLKFFARPGEEGLASLDLREVIAEAGEMMSADARAMGLRLPAPGALPALSVRGNRLRLEQVVVNLLQNARDATRGMPRPEVTVTLEQVGARAELRVADNGAGIDDSIRDAMFEPFASTKASGDGMGLGLSISRAIVRDHNGSLTAAPRPGGGSVFTISLPLEAP